MFTYPATGETVAECPICLARLPQYKRDRVCDECAARLKKKPKLTLDDLRIMMCRFPKAFSQDGIWMSNRKYLSVNWRQMRGGDWIVDRRYTRNNDISLNPQRVHVLLVRAEETIKEQVERTEKEVKAVKGRLAERKRALKFLLSCKPK